MRLAGALLVALAVSACEPLPVPVWCVRYPDGETKTVRGWEHVDRSGCFRFRTVEATEHEVFCGGSFKAGACHR